MTKFVSLICLALLGLPAFSQTTTPEPNPPASSKKDQYAPIDITPYREISDIDPKIVAFRTFGKFTSPQPDGLKSESISVSYSTGKAVVTHTMTGTIDPLISAVKYRLEMKLTGGKWQLEAAGKQQKCRSDNKWRKDKCPG